MFRQPPQQPRRDERLQIRPTAMANRNAAVFEKLFGGANVVGCVNRHAHGVRLAKRRAFGYGVGDSLSARRALAGVRLRHPRDAVERPRQVLVSLRALLPESARRQVVQDGARRGVRRERIQERDGRRRRDEAGAIRNRIQRRTAAARERRRRADRAIIFTVFMRRAETEGGRIRLIERAKVGTRRRPVVRDRIGSVRDRAKSQRRERADH